MLKVACCHDSRRAKGGTAEQQQIRAMAMGGSESLPFTEKPLCKPRLPANG